MTHYERTMLLMSPFLPVLIGKTRGDLHRLAKHFPQSVKLLDVGGRKSPYTIGLNAEVTLLDVPQEKEVQRKLNLGFTDTALASIRMRRSNIVDVVIQDMIHSTLESSSFDIVSCVEVIEHVLEDRAFVEQVYRVLKPGGFAYFTTPNGDYIRNEPPNYNPDHVRHYTRQGLWDLLTSIFGKHVNVVYGVKTGKFRVMGQRSIDVHRPFYTAQMMMANVISHFESRNRENEPRRSAHLFAVAQK